MPKFKTIGGNKDASGIVTIAFIVFMVSLVLRIMTITSVAMIPLMWVGVFLIAASVILKLEPITLMSGIAWLFPIFFIDWITGGFI